MMAKIQAQAPGPSSSPLSITWGTTGRRIRVSLAEAVLMAIDRQEDALPEEVRIKKARRRERKAALKKAREEAAHGDL